MRLSTFRSGVPGGSGGSSPPIHKIRRTRKSNSITFMNGGEASPAHGLVYIYTYIIILIIVKEYMYKYSISELRYRYIFQQLRQSGTISNSAHCIASQQKLRMTATSLWKPVENLDLIFHSPTSLDSQQLTFYMYSYC